MKRQRAFVLASGGVDSTTLLYWAKERYYEVFALMINYGQKHKKELEFVEYHADKLRINTIRESVPMSWFDNGNALIQCDPDAEVVHSEVATGSYQQQRAAGTINTEVPFRNGVFLAVATAIAMSHGGGDILYGAHADDSNNLIYADCSPKFADAMAYAILLGTKGSVSLEAPFVNLHKAGVVAIGKKLGLTYEDYMERTWSCYNGGDRPCGCCGTCIDKRKALEEVFGLNS